MTNETSTELTRRACRSTAIRLCTASIFVTVLLSDAVLVPVYAQALPLASGDRIRVQLADPVSASVSVESPWEGTFLMQRGDTLIARSTYGFDTVFLPMGQLQVVYARRDRGRGHAFVRGAVAGTLFGVLGWQFLNVLCRSACENGLDNAWLPAAGTGLLFAGLVVGQGPGQHWVRVDWPRAAGGSGRR